MKCATITSVCFAFMLLFALPAAVADQTIALHPLKGDSPEVTGRFFDEIVKALSEFPGPYVPYLINLGDDKTVDVSSGGLSAHICPQPTLTKDAPYAITGEVIETSRPFYKIRLYLWDMASRVVLISDELIVDTEEAEAKYLSQLLAWMLSWIDRKEYWLYFGLRIGGGDTSLYSKYPDNRDFVTHFLNGNFALQGSLHFLRWLAFQAEVNYCADISQPWDTSVTEGFFVSSYLTVPLLLRFNWRSGNLMTSLFPGVYFYVPLFKIEDEKLNGQFDYTPNIPGFVFGGSIGWKAGDGYFFMDGRFEYDGHLWSAPTPGHPFYRSMVKLSIGYEGFLKKSVKSAPVKKEKVKAVAPSVVIWDEVIPVIAEEEQEPPEDTESSL